ncbi:hypothetical protein GCM10022416_37010 [Actinomadura keratinilytica]|uniref:Uncharacterized protein n=1 Tax=Actinomadura keratinilytica TaxID=547461 RepID=A0ABP7Z1E6_9ACTN
MGRPAGRHRRVRRRSHARSSAPHRNTQTGTADWWYYASPPDGDLGRPGTPFPTEPFAVHGRGGKHRRPLVRRILGAFVDFG